MGSFPKVLIPIPVHFCTIGMKMKCECTPALTPDFAGYRDICKS